MRRKRNMPKKEHADPRIIGPYAKASETEKGMGHDYTEYADNNK